MFRIEKSKTYKWPVKVEIPQDGGKHVTATFTAEFNRLGQARIEALLIDAGDEDAEFLAEVLAGWSDVSDEDGKAMEYSEAARDQLLDIPYVRVALTKAFFGSVGGKQDKRKN